MEIIRGIRPCDSYSDWFWAQFDSSFLKVFEDFWNVISFVDSLLMENLPPNPAAISYAKRIGMKFGIQRVC